MGIYGRNFAYSIRVPVTFMDKTEFRVEYHSLSKAILGRLIHLPGHLIKEYYLDDNQTKYEELIKKQPKLGFRGLYSDKKRQSVVGGREATLYIHCQEDTHEPHRVQIKSLPLKQDPLIHPSTGTVCDGPDCSFSKVRYTGNDVIYNCKHIEAARDILSHPLRADLRDIRVKSCVPGTDGEPVFGKVQQVFEPVMDSENDFGKRVISEFINRYFFKETTKTNGEGKLYRTWNQYESDLYFHLKYGHKLLSEKAHQLIGWKEGVRCGWEVVKGETGKDKRQIDPVYMDSLQNHGYARSGTVLNKEGNLESLSLDDKTLELSVPDRIIWEHLLTGFDGYVRFFPQGEFQWVRIGLPLGEKDLTKKQGDTEGWKDLVSKGARVVKDSVTDNYSIELPLPDPDNIQQLEDTLLEIKQAYQVLQDNNIL